MKKTSLIFLAALILFGCNKKDNSIGYRDKGDIFGLAGPVKLKKDTSSIHLEDFFINPSEIDSFSFESEARLIISDDRKILKIIATEDLPQMMELKSWIDTVPYSIPVKKSEKIRLGITFDPGNQDYEKVQIAGEMNGWNPGEHAFERKNGNWQKTLLLNPGKYQYQLVVDGQWILDPANPDSVDNNQGGYNSVLQAGPEDATGAPVLYTDQVMETGFQLSYKNPVDEFMIYWQNFRLPQKLYESENGKLTVNIPEQAKEYDRSYIRIWAFNKNGISNNVLIPLENGKVIEDTEKLNRFDHHAMILYNVFIDRFYDADPESNRPLDIPEVLPQADYFGGDILGVTEKIQEGYFRELGVNSIWISPLVKNPEGAYGLWPEPRTKFSGYHGYWPISFTEIDDRYGTEEDLKEMVETAHENGMNVLLDFVANHVHEEHPVIKEHPEWATNLYLPDGSLNTQKWDEHRLTTWFDTFMPTLDLTNPEVVDMVSDSAVYWIKKYNLDGFRHDATKHVPLVFWRTLTRKLKEEVMIPEDKMLYQIGETYGNPELIGSYVSAGKLDAQFDFNVYDDAIAVFARESEGFERLNESLEESLHYYGDHNLMGYITGNQDRPRFISLAGGALSFDEDTKLAGWTREIDVGDPVGYKKLSQLTAFVMTIPGVPVIYYGDEIGDPGGNDPDNRRMLRFDFLNEQEKWVQENVEQLTKLRSGRIELIYGNYRPLQIEKNTFAFMRSYFDKASIVVFNDSEDEKQLQIEIPEHFATEALQANFGGETQLTDNLLYIKLPAHSFDIITN